MDIYSINDMLIEQLTKDQLIVSTSKSFNSLGTNAEKVKLIEKLLIKNDYIPKVESRQDKNNSKSKQLRQKGNILYRKGMAFDALEMYNQSICWAENEDNSEEFALGIGYANRSAIYYNWKMYELCCENIDLAKNAGYPKELMEKLTKRERDSLNYINNKSELKSEKVEYTPKLDLEPNPQIPFIANCLEMKESNDQGRYITTNIELNPGQIVAIEEPYAVILQGNNRYQRCTNCLTENSLSLLPCTFCTNAMFCSQKCQNEANNEYHRFECPISDYLRMFFNKIHISALRVTVKAISLFNCVKEMVKFCQENDNSNVTTFSFDHTNTLSSLERYHQVHCLATNQEKRNTADLFQRATIAAVLYNQLMKHTLLTFLLTKTDGQHAFIELLFRHLQTAPTNFHTLGLAETPVMEGIDYANGAYPFCSLLNHSCAPNVCRMSVGRKMMVFALRVVKPGEQLFDNYGPHHCLSTKESRQDTLLSQYKFTCCCDACRFDYHTIMQLPVARNVPHIHSESDIEKLTKLDAKFASQNLHRFCRYLRESDEYYPCAQIGEAQENLKMCFHILLENYSFKAKTKYLLNNNRKY